MHRSTSLSFWRWNPIQEQYLQLFDEFQCKRTALSNEFRKGRPATSVIFNNIGDVHKMNERGQNVTCALIWKQYVLLYMSIWTYGSFIVWKNQKRLAFIGAKKCSRNSTKVVKMWFTVSLLVTKLQTTIYRLNNSEEVLTNNSSLFVQCCKANDHLFLGNFFKKTICLPEIIKRIRRNIWNRRIIFHHVKSSFEQDIKQLTFCPVKMSK